MFRQGSPGPSTSFKLAPLSLDPASDLFREFWPRVTQEFRHLVQEQEAADNVPPAQSAANVVDDHLFQSPVQSVAIETSLTGEDLLKRPVVSSGSGDISGVNGNVISVNRSLAALLNEYEASTDLPSLAASIGTSQENGKDENVHKRLLGDVNAESALRADFITDITVPDGQAFPPGAEFVKSWRILNSGELDWPGTTALVFAAGESLAKDGSEDHQPVKIGAVAAGKSVDVWSAELKAS